jgi:membrane protease subunit HflC
MRTFWTRSFVIGLAMAVLVGTCCSVVIVDQTESVYVTEFGRPVRLIERPGLHWKWPYQTARAFDRRLQLERPPAREILTRDKKNLEIAWYVSWRIANVGRFLRTVRTVADASARLEDMAASILAAELGTHDLASLVNVGERSMLDSMMSALTERVAEQARREYGLEVVAVRLRRLNYPEEVRPAVFEQIRSERQRVAAATRAEGESQARMIKSAADRERAALIATAEADAARTIGEGEAQAARIANDAQSADPAFYQFLKTLETYRAALDSKTTLVLSADSSFLRLLTQGVADAAGPKARPADSSAGDPVAAMAPSPRGNSLQAAQRRVGHESPSPLKGAEGRKP